MTELYNEDDIPSEEILLQQIIDIKGNFKCYQEMNILDYTIRKCSILILEWLFHNKLNIFKNNISYINYLLTFSAQKGDLEIFKWFHNIQFPFNGSIIAYSINEGHLELTNWFYNNVKYNNVKHNYPKYYMYTAIQQKHYHIVSWLHNNIFKDESIPDLLDKAIIHGNLDIVKFLYYNRKEECTKDILKHEINQDVTDFLHSVYGKIGYGPSGYEPLIKKCKD